ncbi:hypothetical protein UlMin_007462 [Ulmus minor]
MSSGFGVLMKLRRVFLPASPFLISFPGSVAFETRLVSLLTTCSTICQSEAERVPEEDKEHLKDSMDVFKSWGCNDDEIFKIFKRRPSLKKAGLDMLQYKLELLSGLGVSSSDLVKIINCRPRFLSCCINRCFDERLEFLTKLFGSREVLVKAIVRNPSLLTYDFHNKIKPIIAQYEELGLSKEDLTAMLILRPTIIPRTSFNDEKMEYIEKTGCSQNSKMYKYVVTLIGVSRLETIRLKVANFEKFGFTDEEVLGLIGRSPLVLTLSVDKVQRNMTFILSKMKLPAKVVLENPNLLYSNLEAALKPRVLIAEKLKEMGLPLQIQGPDLLRALRMTEKRFVKAFLSCHPKEVADELMRCYKTAKEMKRLAEASKKNLHLGFPF